MSRLNHPSSHPYLMSRVVSWNGGWGRDVKQGAGETLGYLSLGGFNCLCLFPKSIRVSGLLPEGAASASVRVGVRDEGKFAGLQGGCRASNAWCGCGEGELGIQPVCECVCVHVVYMCTRIRAIMVMTMFPINMLHLTRMPPPNTHTHTTHPCTRTHQSSPVFCCTIPKYVTCMVLSLLDTLRSYLGVQLALLTT